MTTAEQIAACTTLDQLLAVMTAMSHDDDTIDMADLPVFGGPEPENTMGVWSWDAERLIVGTCSSDFEIVSRDWLTQ